MKSPPWVSILEFYEILREVSMENVAKSCIEGNNCGYLQVHCPMKVTIPVKFPPTNADGTDVITSHCTLHYTFPHPTNGEGSSYADAQQFHGGGNP